MKRGFVLGGTLSHSGRIAPTFSHERGDASLHRVSMANADRLILIYNEASARPPGPERDRFIAESCGDDAEMRERVASLLRSLQSVGNFLQEPIFPPTARI